MYHGYQSDPVRFRVLHAGEAVTHVHHLHAHQWLYNAKERGSNYLVADVWIADHTSTSVMHITHTSIFHFTPRDRR